MGFLVDWEIVALIAAGRIGVSPYDDPDLVQPASLDVRLGTTLRWYGVQTGERVLDPRQDSTAYLIVGDIPVAGWILSPGEFILATTLETLHLPADIAARLEGKSSLGRLGLSTHITAGFIDPGFAGTLTLELKNETHLPIRLHAGMRIGQIAFSLLGAPAQRPYGHPDRRSKYQLQQGPTASRMWQERSR